MKTIEDKLYDGFLDFLLDKESKGHLIGADNLSKILAHKGVIALLKKQQKDIYDALPSNMHEALSSGEIGERIGLSSKNVSSQIKNITNKSTIIGVIKNGKNNKYYKHGYYEIHQGN